MEPAVLGQTNGCRATEEAGGVRQPRGKSGSSNSSVSFSKELIYFSLYGKIPRESKRPWNESKIAQVQSSFKNIPPTLYFSPSSVTFDGVGVYAAVTLPKGTRLGPYICKAVKKEEMEEEMHEWLWEVYQDSSLAYFIDTSDPKDENWMNFIECARNQQRQNLKALRHGDCLYFESVRDSGVREELLVWYDDLQYDIYFGITVAGYKEKSSGAEHSSRSSSSYPGSRPSSENGEDLFPGSAPCPAPSSRQSDTGTEDSGISISFEQGGASLNVPSLATAVPTDSTGDCAGDGSGPMESFPSPQTEPKGAFQIVSSGGHTESATAECGSGVMPASWGSSQQQLSPQMELVLWPTSDNPPRSSTVDGMFIQTPDGTRWQCKKCKRLYRQGSMRGHARIHTGDRPYQCQYCGRSFCQHLTLRSHERLHTGEKPYQCEHCGQVFTQSAGLRSHLKTHRYDSQ